MYTAVTGVNTSGSTYTFTFGAAVTGAGETVSYYIVAQDAAGTPNVSCSPVGGAAGFNVNPPSVSTPPSSPNTYLAGASFAGVYTVGTGGTYPNLTGASGLFNAINTSTVTGNVYISVRSNLVEPGTVGLRQFAAPYTIQIRPGGSAATRLIEGTTVGTGLPMIDLAGADRVNINGADSATNTGQYFRFVNNNVTAANTGPVFRFIDDARQDSLRNCIIESNASSSTIPLVLFGTTVNSAGNDSNTIDNCLFKQSAGTNPGRYAMAFLNAGSGTGGLAVNNGENNITNCNFTGMLAASTITLRFNAGLGSNWVISNNKIYNDVNFSAGHTVLFLSSTTSNNMTVSGNSVGGSAPDRSGTCFGASGTFNTTGLQIIVGSSIASNVQGNIVANFGSTLGAATAISVSGKVNVGTSSGNIIGGLANPWDTCVCGNTAQWLRCASGDTVRTENNTIGNCSYYGNFDAANIGLEISTGLQIVRNNTIRDIKGDNIDQSTSSNTVKGIYMTSAATGNVYIEGNTIYNLQNTWTGFGQVTGAVFTPGIHYNGTGTCTIARNRIYNISSACTGTGGVASRNIGIYNTSTADLNIINNQITLTASTLQPFLVGIYNQVNGPVNILYNSVYIGGVCADTLNTSYCYYRNTTSADTLRNNLFINQRTGGANNYCMGLNSQYLWTAKNSNYNSFLPSAANQVGVYGPNAKQTFANWKTNAGCDASSVSQTGVNAANLFTSIAAGNLNINPANVECWNVSGLGTAVTSPQVYNDFTTSSTVRAVTVAEGVTDIGSNTFTPLVVPPDVTPSGTPANNGSTTFTYLGRTLGTINWGPSGTVPTAVSFKFYPGANPPGSNGFSVGNGYWVITATGGSGYTYDIMLNYDDAMIGPVNPEADLRIAKSEDNGVSWRSYDINGNGPDQFELDTTNNTITVYGLTGFSTFALTDGDQPLPVEISSFISSVDKRNVTLTWSTISEQNNSGFDIERKTSGSESNWSKVGNVSGSGTSVTVKNYSFTENNMNTGKYKYRLKQIDFNGSYRYHELSNEVIIGVPAKFELSQNYPNPFNPTTKINYDLPFDSKVSIKLFDMTGREVALIVNSVQTAGYYTVQFNAGSLASGAYFYNIVAEGGNTKFITTKKMVLVK